MMGSFGPLNWPTQTKKFLPKICYAYPKKQYFKGKQFSHQPQK